MPIDYTQLITRIVPKEDAEDSVKLRTGTVVTLYTDGTADISVSGVTLRLPVLSGAAVFVGGVVQILSYRGSMLVIGQIQVGATAPLYSENMANVSTTGTSYAAAVSNNVGGFFRVPASGRVRIDFSGELYGAGATGQIMSFEIREGSTVGAGTVVLAADDERAVRSYDVNRQQFSNFYVWSAGTPGSTYNIRLLYRTTSGTANFERRRALVAPIMI